MTAQFVSNPENKVIHVGERDGDSVLLNPSCNITLARSEGDEGTIYVTNNRALDLINEGWKWCRHCAKEQVNGEL